MRLKPGARLTGAAQIQCAAGVLTPRSLSQVSAWEEALPRKYKEGGVEAQAIAANPNP